MKFGFCQSFILFVLGTVFVSERASAKDYYWWYTSGTSYPDAVSACQAYAVAANEAKWLYSRTVVYPESTATWAGAYCYFINIETPRRYEAKFGKVGRTGDGCTLPKVYDINTKTCDSNGAGRGEPEAKSCVGDPINIENGNVFEREADFQSKISPLLFARIYNSLDGVWRHSYSANIQVVDGGVKRTTSEGREFIYVVISGEVLSPPSDQGKLSKLADGWVYVAETNEVFNFDAKGRLVQIITSAGKKLRLAYVGSLVSVTDELGGALSFTEDAQRQPLSFTTSGISIQYTYNANQRLVQLSRTSGGDTEFRKFHYENSRNPGLLTGETDARGVRISSWTYDEQGRATSSQHAGGAELTQVAYSADGTRTVTNELGKSTLYQFVEVGNVKRVSAIEGEPSANCPASNSTFTYNDRGQVLTQTDAKGFITTHTYNDRGLETTRTEASGTPQARTTTTTWHSTFNLPLTVTEGGQVTTYTYDTQGRQTSRTQTAL